MKFGGTSVGSPEAIRQVFSIVRQSSSMKPLVVVSAFSGITDSLAQLFAALSDRILAKQLADAIFHRHLNVARALGLDSPEEILGLNASLQRCLEDTKLTGRALRDEILSYGERYSSVIIAAYFTAHEIPSRAVDARELITTNEDYGHAVVDLRVSYEQIQKAFQSSDVLSVVTGYIARSSVGTTTTLGRGGSDYSATLLGAALGVREIQIWSDVNGICTSDPRLDVNAGTFSHLTYQEAFELAQAGAKVIYPPAIIPAEQAGIPLVVKNTFNPRHAGTVITIPGLAHHSEHEAA